MRSMQRGKSERFYKVRLLGEGATSRIFEVHDAVYSTRYALKIRKRTRGGRHRRHIHGEHGVLNRISHDNVVRSAGLIEYGAQPALLMELVSGVDFLGYARPDGGTHPRLDTCTGGSSNRNTAEVVLGGAWIESRLRSAVTQLAEGLMAVHAANYVHCDIKPDNILVTRDGRLVILDFGSACSPAYVPGLCRGTPGFMAPEQQSGVLGQAADWYAVGVLLYCALTGRLPLGTAAIGRPLFYTAPLDPHWLAPDLPDDLVRLAMRLLDPDPRTRASGADVIRAAGARSAAARDLTVMNRPCGSRTPGDLTVNLEVKRTHCMHHAEFIPAAHVGEGEKLKCNSTRP